MLSHEIAEGSGQRALEIPVNEEPLSSGERPRSPYKPESKREETTLGKLGLNTLADIVSAYRQNNGENS
ncbi:MAG: hypothetical protein UY42_C0017G0006 [Parcubacteria group bacterium GW2011_GWA2_49_16]|nr:MAG: hypothetical protein UY42_C0017G0006 [Parcubacteria group bacterium GW2011_GWA2_49_16]